jgi:ABC-type sugar transport system ATPase subunit
MTLGDKVVVMREGEVHQIDRPEMIYNKPADTFVATFIGSPVMNLFKGRMIKQKGRFILKTEDFSIDSIGGDWGMGSRELEIGIRPEDITVSLETDNGLRAKVEMVTDVGADKYAHTRVGSTGLTARIERQVSIEHGEYIYLGVDQSRLHFFDEGRKIKK